MRHKDSEVDFDWADQVIDPETREHQVAWGFLYSDVEHEVLPVISGTRITLAYDVYAIDRKSNLSATILADPIGDGLSRLVAPAMGFCPEGGQVAIGLQHAYPSSGGKDTGRNLIPKGEDRAILDAIISLGYSWSITSVATPRTRSTSRRSYRCWRICIRTTKSCWLRIGLVVRPWLPTPSSAQRMGVKATHER